MLHEGSRCSMQAHDAQMPTNSNATTYNDIRGRYGYPSGGCFLLASSKREYQGNRAFVSEPPLKFRTLPPTGSSSSI